MKIAVLVGSLRKESYNLKAAKELIALAPKELNFEIIEIGQLPFYNEDLETDTPLDSWKSFREKIKASHGVLFVSPEYNRSVPAVIKNAIDVGSRPYTANVWKGKAAAVVTVSTGATGGMACNLMLRNSLTAIDMPTLQSPEAYIGNAKELFKEGKLTNEKTIAFFTQIMTSYAAWVKKIHV